MNLDLNNKPQSFSGSYQQGDVAFLLQTIDIDMTPVSLKEELIQSGRVHYSDMLSQEPEPTAYHLELFKRAWANGSIRLASEVMAIAKRLADEFKDTPIVLVSLVRAGVPLGVMLHRALQLLGKDSIHYGISIIRDRGIDTKALDIIEQKHDIAGIVFVDGWTGKGAITQQLRVSLKGRQGYPELPRLVVLADPAGVSWLAASADDWLIPFGILGAPISGMISRSVWSETELHGCILCDHLAQYECSRWLVDSVERIWRDFTAEKLDSIKASQWQSKAVEHLYQQCQQVIEVLADRYNIDSVNRIKPGIAEATRAVLRRVPEHILVKDTTDPDVALLVYLANEKQIKVIEAGELIGQYKAVTIIKKVL